MKHGRVVCHPGLFQTLSRLETHSGRGVDVVASLAINAAHRAGGLNVPLAKDVVVGEEVNAVELGPVAEGGYWRAGGVAVEAEE